MDHNFKDPKATGSYGCSRFRQLPSKTPNTTKHKTFEDAYRSAQSKFPASKHETYRTIQETWHATREIKNKLGDFERRLRDAQLSVQRERLENPLDDAEKYVSDQLEGPPRGTQSLYHGFPSTSKRFLHEEDRKASKYRYETGSYRRENLFARSRSRDSDAIRPSHNTDVEQMAYHIPISTFLPEEQIRLPTQSNDNDGTIDLLNSQLNGPQREAISMHQDTLGKEKKKPPRSSSFPRKSRDQISELGRSQSKPQTESQNPGSQRAQQSGIGALQHTNDMGRADRRNHNSHDVIVKIRAFKKAQTMKVNAEREKNRADAIPPQKKPRIMNIHQRIEKIKQDRNSGIMSLGLQLDKDSDSSPTVSKDQKRENPPPHSEKTSPKSESSKPNSISDASDLESRDKRPPDKAPSNSTSFSTSTTSSSDSSSAATETQNREGQQGRTGMAGANSNQVATHNENKDLTKKKRYDPEEVRKFMAKQRAERRRLARDPPREQRIDRIRHYDAEKIQEHMKREKITRRKNEQKREKQKEEEKLKKLERCKAFLEKQKAKSKIPTSILLLRGPEPSFQNKNQDDNVDAKMKKLKVEIELQKEKIRELFSRDICVHHSGIGGKYSASARVDNNPNLFVNNMRRFSDAANEINYDRHSDSAQEHFQVHEQQNDQESEHAEAGENRIEELSSGRESNGLVPADPFNIANTLLKKKMQDHQNFDQPNNVEADTPMVALPGSIIRPVPGPDRENSFSRALPIETLNDGRKLSILDSFPPLSPAIQSNSNGAASTSTSFYDFPIENVNYREGRETLKDDAMQSVPLEMPQPLLSMKVNHAENDSSLRMEGPAGAHASVHLHSISKTVAVPNIPPIRRLLDESSLSSSDSAPSLSSLTDENPIVKRNQETRKRRALSKKRNQNHPGALEKKGITTQTSSRYICDGIGHISPAPINVAPNVGAESRTVKINRVVESSTHVHRHANENDGRLSPGALSLKFSSGMNQLDALETHLRQLASIERMSQATKSQQELGAASKFAEVSQEREMKIQREQLKARQISFENEQRKIQNEKEIAHLQILQQLTHATRETSIEKVSDESLEELRQLRRDWEQRQREQEIERERARAEMEKTKKELLEIVIANAKTAQTQVSPAQTDPMTIATIASQAAASAASAAIQSVLDEQRKERRSRRSSSERSSSASSKKLSSSRTSSKRSSSQASSNSRSEQEDSLISSKSPQFDDQLAFPESRNTKATGNAVNLDFSTAVVTEINKNNMAPLVDEDFVISLGENSEGDAPTMEQDEPVGERQPEPEGEIRTEIESENEQSPSNLINETRSIKEASGIESNSLEGSIRSEVSVEESIYTSGKASTYTTSQVKTQMDTSLSEQSEYEGRIKAMRSELNEKRSTAARLKKEYKRRSKEHYESTEMSLKKQLNMYDRYIRDTSSQLKELERASTAGTGFARTSMSPRIGSPRPQVSEEYPVAAAGSTPSSPRKLRSPCRTILPSPGLLLRSRSSSLSESLPASIIRQQKELKDEIITIRSRNSLSRSSDTSQSIEAVTPTKNDSVEEEVLKINLAEHYSSGRNETSEPKSHLETSVEEKIAEDTITDLPSEIPSQLENEETTEVKETQPSTSMETSIKSDIEPYQESINRSGVSTEGPNEEVTAGTSEIEHSVSSSGSSTNTVKTLSNMNNDEDSLKLGEEAIPFVGVTELFPRQDNLHVDSTLFKETPTTEGIDKQEACSILEEFPASLEEAIGDQSGFVGRSSIESRESTPRCELNSGRNISNLESPSKIQGNDAQIISTEEKPLSAEHSPDFVGVSEDSMNGRDSPDHSRKETTSLPSDAENHLESSSKEDSDQSAKSVATSQETMKDKSALDKEEQQAQEESSSEKTSSQISNAPGQHENSEKEQIMKDSISKQDSGEEVKENARVNEVLELSESVSSSSSKSGSYVPELSEQEGVGQTAIVELAEIGEEKDERSSPLTESSAKNLPSVHLKLDLGSLKDHEIAKENDQEEGHQSHVGDEEVPVISSADSPKRTEDDVSSLSSEDDEIDDVSELQATEINKDLDEATNDSSKPIDVPAQNEAIANEILSGLLDGALDDILGALKLENSEPAAGFYGVISRTQLDKVLQLSHSLSLEGESHIEKSLSPRSSPRSPYAEKFEAIFRKSPRSPKSSGWKETTNLGYQGLGELPKVEADLDEFDTSPIEEFIDDDFGFSQPKPKSESTADTSPRGKPKTLSKSFTTEEFAAVPTKSTEIDAILEKSSQLFWEQRENGGKITLTNAKARDLFDTKQFLESGRSIDDLDLSMNKKSDLAFRQMIFQWCREVASEVLSIAPCSEVKEDEINLIEKQPWRKLPRLQLSRIKKVAPANRAELSETLRKEVFSRLDIERDSFIEEYVAPNGRKPMGREKMVSRKRLDRMDELLLAEMYEEEPDWVDYDKDEEQLKLELADQIWDETLTGAIDDILSSQKR